MPKAELAPIEEALAAAEMQSLGDIASNELFNGSGVRSYKSRTIGKPGTTPLHDQDPPREDY